MLIYPFVLVLGWTLAEVFVIIKVAEAIGVLDTLLLLVLSWPIGTWALRSQGAAAWRRMAAALAAGRPPGHEVVDGGLIVLGGALLIIPGFISDALGILLLLPPTRAVVRRGVLRNFRSRVLVRAARFRRPARASYDVDASAAHIDSAAIDSPADDSPAAKGESGAAGERSRLRP